MTRRPSNDLRHRVAVASAEPDCGIFAMSVEPSNAHGKSPIWQIHLQIVCELTPGPACWMPRKARAS